MHGHDLTQRQKSEVNRAQTLLRTSLFNHDLSGVLRTYGRPWRAKFRETLSKAYMDKCIKLCQSDPQLSFIEMSAFSAKAELSWEKGNKDGFLGSLLFSQHVIWKFGLDNASRLDRDALDKVVRQIIKNKDSLDNKMPRITEPNMLEHAKQVYEHTERALEKAAEIWRRLSMAGAIDCLMAKVDCALVIASFGDKAREEARESIKRDIREVAEWAAENKAEGVSFIVEEVDKVARKILERKLNSPIETLRMLDGLNINMDNPSTGVNIYG